MKSWILFTGACVIYFAAIYPLAAEETCPVENCITPDKCEDLVKSSEMLCNEPGTSCCSVVKTEFRTKCRHHGGECFSKCNPDLVRIVDDCPSNEMCCVLIK